MSDQVRAELAEVLAAHHCRMHKKGPIECWSTLDGQECGLRFTTGGQYRAHVAQILAEYVATKQAEFIESGQAWDVMQAHIDKRKADWQAEALREAASCPIPDGFMNVKRWLRDRADRIAP